MLTWSDTNDVKLPINVLRFDSSDGTNINDLEWP